MKQFVSQYINFIMKDKKEYSLIDNDFWISGEWKQPPVRIKHGYLVEVKCDDYLGTMLGRYIGKGM